MHITLKVAEPDHGKATAPENPLNVVILYDQVHAAHRATRQIARIVHGMDGGTTFEPQLWRANLLHDQDWFTISLAEAVQADIIVLAFDSAGDSENPLVTKWVKQCASQKSPHSSAIIAMIGPADQPAGPGAGSIESFHRIVQEAHQDFFVPQSRSEFDFSTSIEAATD